MIRSEPSSWKMQADKGTQGVAQYTRENRACSKIQHSVGVLPVDSETRAQGVTQYTGKTGLVVRFNIR